MRELDYQETDRLAECLKELAEHHNEVSNGFKGCYPKRPFADPSGRMFKAGNPGLRLLKRTAGYWGFAKQTFAARRERSIT